jgi:hypothetical protein
MHHFALRYDSSEHPDILPKLSDLSYLNKVDATQEEEPSCGIPISKRHVLGRDPGAFVSVPPPT